MGTPPGKPARLRYLWVFSAADDWTFRWHQAQLARRRQRGFDVEHFCTTIPYLGGRWLPFPQLEQRWRMGDRTLMRMYEDLASCAAGKDVLVLYNGANLHPEFVAHLNLFKVYTAGDPESNEVLARPLAPAFDIHLVNQAPSIELFRSWGLEHVHFWPLGSLVTEEDVRDIESNMLDVSTRPVPIVFVNERSRHRQARTNQLVQAFPDAFIAGQGWPRGFLSYADMYAAYRQGQVGWNVHNTTGFNFRTWELPAHGVMQICDNKSDLGRIFTVGKEVIAFESIAECIELTRYYLAHPEEQRQIAWAAWQRWRTDYTPDKIWDRLVEIVEPHVAAAEGRVAPSVSDMARVRQQLHRRTRRHPCRRLGAYTRERLGRIGERARAVLRRWKYGNS